MTVLVTGAGGFVGQRLVRDLIAAGFGVRGTSRFHGTALASGAKLAVIPNPTDRAALASALAGVSTVVHLAARVHVMHDSSADPLSAFRHVNVAQTEALCRAAREAGVERLVFISSVKVNGEERDEPYSERDPARPADPYGISKQEAEETVRRELGSEVGWIILRPPLVYGPGVKGNFGRLLRLAQLSGKIPLPLGAADNHRSIIFVGNLSSAIMTSLASTDVRSNTFLVSDGEDVSTSDLLRRLAAAMNVHARLPRFPTPALRTFFRVIGKSAEAQRLFGNLTVDASRFRSILGWTPPFTLEQGLEETAHWWKAQR